MDKSQAYKNLIKKRKAFQFSGLLNPSEFLDGQYDCDHVEAWAQWMGNLNAKIMLVGKDFGGSNFFVKFKGRCDPNSITNRNLMRLFTCLGIEICSPSFPNIEAPIFFTNVIVGILESDKKGGNNINTHIIHENAIEFLLPLINIVNTNIIITMGKEAYVGVSIALGLPRNRKLIDLIYESPIRVGKELLIFPTFHCGGLGLANRSFDKQRDDWKRINDYKQTLHITTA